MFECGFGKNGGTDVKKNDELSRFLQFNDGRASSRQVLGLRRHRQVPGARARHDADYRQRTATSTSFWHQCSRLDTTTPRVQGDTLDVVPLLVGCQLVLVIRCYGHRSRLQAVNKFLQPGLNVAWFGGSELVSFFPLCIGGRGQTACMPCHVWRAPLLFFFFSLSCALSLLRALSLSLSVLILTFIFIGERDGPYNANIAPVAARQVRLG